MFDIGFWEMALIAVVALVVVGPRELPALLRGVSSWVGRAREFASEFKNELSREAAHAEELRKMVERESEVAELHKLLDEARSQIPLDGPAAGGKSGEAGDAKPGLRADPASPGASGQARDGQSS